VRTARLRWAALVAAAVLAVAGPAPRARAQSTGTTAGALLTIPATARSLGLGGAYTAVVGDEGNIFVNPAGLAAISHAALGVSYEKYLFDSYLVSAGVAFRSGEFDLGLGVEMLYVERGAGYEREPKFSIAAPRPI